MSDLVVYENHDIFLEYAKQVRVPWELGTLEEFLAYLSSRITDLSGNARAASRYRFLYSLTGKPLWRVADCHEAGKVVVSCSPGFLPRMSSGNTDFAAPFSSAIFQKCDVQTENKESFCHPGIRCSAAATTRSNRKVSSIQKECLNGRSHSEPLVSKEGSKPHAVLTNAFFGSCNVESCGTTYFVAGERVTLPPLPRFEERVFGGSLEMSRAENVAVVQTLVSLKLVGRSFLENELLFRDELQSIVSPIFSEQRGTANSTALCREHAIRVVVEGPPKSGVSTVLAYSACLAASSADNRFRDCLFLPINFELLFDHLGVLATGEMFGSRNVTSDGDKEQAHILDAPPFFLSVMRLLLDCAAAQRPSLREVRSALVEAWERVVDCNDTVVLQFSDARLTRTFEQRVLHRWSTFAAAAARVLRAARDAPHDMSLRDAVVETVLVEFVAQIASGLRFSGVLYIVDGLRLLMMVLQHRVLRPLGDAGVFLRYLARCPWAHIIAGVDTLVLPPCSVLIPGDVQCIKLLFMLTYEKLTRRYGYPVLIRCGKKKFSLQLFLGAPGYLKLLHALLEGCDRSAMGIAGSQAYTLCVEDTEVLSALQGLAEVLRLDSAP